MKVIIAGGRDFNDYELLRDKCLYYLQNTDWGDLEIVSGHARGADTLGERFAKELNLPLKIFPADWDKYGKGAGPIRNRQMAEYADCLIAFLCEGSKGTASMIRIAKELKLPIRVVKY